MHRSVLLTTDVMFNVSSFLTCSKKESQPAYFQNSMANKLISEMTHPSLTVMVTEREGELHVHEEVLWLETAFFEKLVASNQFFYSLLLFFVMACLQKEST